MYKIFLLLVISVPLALSSCTKGGKEGRATERDGNIIREYYSTGVLKAEISVKDSFRHGPTKNYDMQGNLLSEVNYVNNVKEGLVTNYYVPSGKVSSTFTYVNGIKQGEEKWFYENGQVYRITPYVDGKMNGIQKYYYENGQLMAEVPYKNNQPGIGLKEYNPDGSLKGNYPTIRVVREDYLLTANSVVLRISLSDNSTEVQFYRGELEDEKYMNDKMSLMAVQSGVAQMSFNLPRGAKINQVIPITANMKTPDGLPYITHLDYSLQVVNSF